MATKREDNELMLHSLGVSNTNNYRHKKFNCDYTHKKFGIRSTQLGPNSLTSPVDSSATTDDGFRNTLTNNTKNFSRSTTNIFRPYALDDDTQRKRKTSTSHWAVNQLAVEEEEQNLSKRYASSEDIFTAQTMRQEQRTMSVNCLQQEQQKQQLQLQQRQQQVHEQQQQQLMQRCVSLGHINSNHSTSGSCKSQPMRHACSTVQLPSLPPVVLQADRFPSLQSTIVPPQQQQQKQQQQRVMPPIVMGSTSRRYPNPEPTGQWSKIAHSSSENGQQRKAIDPDWPETAPKTPGGIFASTGLQQQQQRVTNAPAVNNLQTGLPTPNLAWYPLNKQTFAIMLQKQSAALLVRQYLFRSSGNVNHPVYNDNFPTWPSPEMPLKSNMTTLQLNKR